VIKTIPKKKKFKEAKWLSEKALQIAGKESACNAGDPGLFPGLGRSPGEGNGYPLQYSGMENSMDCIIHGVAAKSQTRLSQKDFYNYLSFKHINTFK